MMRLWAGTSGFQYREWIGHFYPEGTRNKDMLAAYARLLPSVEINSSFYRIPAAPTLERWATQVPDDFRFALKASRRITHQQRLADSGETARYFLQTVATLGSRLGPVLMQLPPSFRKDRDRLLAFIRELPEGARIAFEFRHDSWYDEDIYRLLRERDMALCLVDTDERTLDTMAWVTTASWGYLRLRRDRYDRATLARWAERSGDCGWQDVYAYFKHERQAPELARSLHHLV